jgi:SpoVK/Ycf46/Vps4 family AAA+-type ATPase
MGDNTHRGRVIWITATNRPDILDDALLSRFDRIIPFLPPTQGERERIFRAMERMVGVEYAPDIDLSTVAQHTEGLTGRFIEVIVRQAAELAGEGPITTTHLRTAIADYKPGHNQEVYEWQSLLALAATNFYSMLPRDLPPRLQTVIAQVREQGDNSPIQERINTLQQKRRAV